MSKLTDIFGRPLEVGQFVVYASSSSSRVSMTFGKVESFRDRSFTIRIYRESRTEKGVYRPSGAVALQNYSDSHVCILDSNNLPVKTNEQAKN